MDIILKEIKDLFIGKYPIDNTSLFNFLYFTPVVLAVIIAIAVIAMICLNEPLRKRKRMQDRLIYSECILLIGWMFFFIFSKGLYPISAITGQMENDIFYNITILMFGLSFPIIGVFDLLILLQWLVCVDYCLYQSEDHIRLRYRHAAIPIIIIASFNIVLAIFFYTDYDQSVIGEILNNISYILERVIYAGYVFTAIFIVWKYGKDRREPRFLRLDAFLTPFIIGHLFPFFKEFFVGLGIILTYSTIRRRDKYIDSETGLYKDMYLDHISSMWDKKNFTDANAILLSAPGHGPELAKILLDIRIQDCFIIRTDEGKFLILTPSLRNSAVRMTMMMLSEAALESDDPFEIGMKSLKRADGQSMMEFSEEIRKSMASLTPSEEGGARAL